MSEVLRTNITTKTLSVFAISAILFAGIVPNIFAMSADEEAELGKNIAIDMTRNVGTRDVSVSVVGHVDLQLQLLVDISGSVDGTEFALQRDGYVAAFQDNSVGGVIDRIESAPSCIAVQYVVWSGSTQQQVVVPADGTWEKLCTEADSLAFAAAIAASPRPFANTTAPGTAINFGVAQFDTEFTSDRKVIDVSGDGIENAGVDTSDARDAALLAGIDTINGITIGTEDDVHLWYPIHVVGGDGSFAISVANFADFPPSIKEKLTLEIPDPCESNPEECNPPTVAGEFLPINTTSLLVAGLASNALWIAPISAGIVGMGLYLARSMIK